MLYTVHLQARERKPPSCLPGTRNPNRLTLISSVFGRLGVETYRLPTDERETKLDHKKKEAKNLKDEEHFAFCTPEAMTFKNEMVT